MGTARLQTGVTRAVKKVTTRIASGMAMGIGARIPRGGGRGGGGVWAAANLGAAQAHALPSISPHPKVVRQ